MEAIQDGYNHRQRWWALSKINAASALAQIVQIGTVTPLQAISLEQRGVEAAEIGLVVSAPWIAILLLHKSIPRLLQSIGLLNSNLLAAALSSVSLLGMTLSQQLTVLFVLNFVLGIGLILRWIACDTWIVAVASEHERGRAIGVHETLMGLGIATGPLLILLFGLDGPAPYYACIVLVLISGLLAATLKAHDSRPKIPCPKQHGKLFKLIPVALCGAFMAGYTETSAVSFLAPYSLSAGYLLSSATLLLAMVGTGDTLLQLPVGWLADRSSFKTGQLICSVIVLLGTLIIPFCHSLPWLAALVVFIWGGAIGGLNTLAVIEAGNRVAESQLSTAMTAIALCFTLGSVLGPIVTGAAVTYVSPHGLMISTGVAGVLFIILLSRQRPQVA